MSNRQPLVAGNWKLNGTRSSAVALATDVAASVGSLSIEALVCPTFVHLADVLAVVGNSPLHMGAQNCSLSESGAFTGEVSAPMLAEYGCEYVIVGHSERRQLFGEDSAAVAHKVKAVLDASLMPILCVGETLEEREKGAIQSVIDEQLDAVVELVGLSAFADLVVAYEPVWAIGTGVTASPEQAQEVHAMIRAKVAAGEPEIAQRLRILYGGSVKPDNAADLFGRADIDGGLIGGAALDAKSFVSICEAADAAASAS